MERKYNTQINNVSAMPPSPEETKGLFSSLKGWFEQSTNVFETAVNKVSAIAENMQKNQKALEYANSKVNTQQGLLPAMKTIVKEMIKQEKDIKSTDNRNFDNVHAYISNVTKQRPQVCLATDGIDIR